MWLISKILISGNDIYVYQGQGILQSMPEFTNNPNTVMYSTLTNIILSPLGLFSFENAKITWLLINCTLIFHIFMMFNHHTKINKFKLCIIFIVFLLSKPLVYGIGLGQFAIVALYGFVCLFFLQNKIIKYFFVALSVSKFTFAPILGIFLILRKEFKLIIFLIITQILAVFIYCIYFENSFFKVFLLQFFWPAKHLTSGAIDLMTLIGNNPAPPFNYILVIIISIIVTIFYYINTKRDKISDLAALSLLTILLIRHLYYDMVFLLPFIIYLSELKKNKISIIIITFHFLFFYYNDLTADVIRYNKFFMLINFCLMGYLFCYIFYNNKKIYFFDDFIKKYKIF